MLLYLVRHGETDWNRARRIQGTTDVPLNDTGREQAGQTGRLLARRRISSVVTSPLSRATETAAIIAAELGLPAPAALAPLVEREYGEAEGLDYRQIAARFPDNTPVPGRESRESVADRAVPALLELMRSEPSDAVVAVTHGGVIRSVLATVEPGQKYPAITNGSVHSFRWVEGALNLIAFDDPIEELSEHGEPLSEQNPLEARK